VKELRRALLIRGYEFPDSEAADRWSVFALAASMRVPPWELEQHPEWLLWAQELAPLKAELEERESKKGL